MSYVRRAPRGVPAGPCNPPARWTEPAGKLRVVQEPARRRLGRWSRYGMTQVTHFFDQQVADRALMWGDVQWQTMVHNSHFRRCDITISCSSRGLALSDSTFQDCTIRLKRFKDHPFVSVGFDGCQFAGRYVGCVFGFRDMGQHPRAMHGYVRHCDFTGATLETVEFNGTDLATLRLPPWPHFLVKSQAAFAAVSEFADDPEWTGWTTVPWEPETSGIVMLYRAGGRRGFRMPPQEASRVLKRYSELIAITAA